jgi:short-subunit dehydrogenase
MEGLEIFGVAISGSAAGGLAAYYAAKEAINVMIARIDERLKALKETVESDHAKLETVRHDFYSSRGVRE